MIAIAVRPIASPISARRMSGLATVRTAPGVSTSMTQIPAMTMNTPSPAASIKYSGQWLKSVERARLISAPRSEFGVERHAAIDEQSDPVDIVAVVGGQPNRSARYVFGFTDPLVGHEPHQRLVSLRRRPRGGVDRRARGTRCEAIDPDAARCQLLGDRLHQH